MSRPALLTLVVLSLASLACTAQADTATIVILPGENWVAPPLVPLNPDPTSVFGACIANCTLTKLDPTTETEHSHPNPEFGNVLLGDGIKVRNPTANTYVCTYDGVSDGVPSGGIMTDMWVTLPGNQYDGLDAGGLIWFGHPFYHDTPISACFVTDGTHVRPIEEAVADGWLDGVFSYMDAETQTVRTAGLAELGVYDTWFRATHMYEIRSHIDMLALIVPAYVVPEPSGLAVLVPALAIVLFRRRSTR